MRTFFIGDSGHGIYFTSILASSWAIFVFSAIVVATAMADDFDSHLSSKFTLKRLSIPSMVGNNVGSFRVGDLWDLRTFEGSIGKKFIVGRTLLGRLIIEGNICVVCFW